jgi:integrase
MAVRQRGSGWQAGITHNGQRFRYLFKSLEAAELWEAEALLAARKGLPVPSPRETPSGRAATAEHRTLGAVFEYTKVHEWADAKSGRQLIRRGEEVVEALGKDTLVDDIGRLEIDQFIKSLKDKRNAGGTINRKLAALSKMLTVAQGLNKGFAKPVIKRQREAEGRERYLSYEEEDAIAATFRNWNLPAMADLVEFLCDTGLRVGEALGLSWKECRNSVVTVVGSASKDDGRRGSKTGKTRHVPMTERVEAILKRRRVAAGGTGPFSEVTYYSFRFQFEKVLEHLELDDDDIVIHTMRHTFGSRLVINGVDLYRVMQLMGHTTMKTTMRYAKLSPSSLQEATGALSRRTPGLPIEAPQPAQRTDLSPALVGA